MNASWNHGSRILTRKFGRSTWTVFQHQRCCGYGSHQRPVNASQRYLFSSDATNSDSKESAEQAQIGNSRSVASTRKQRRLSQHNPPRESWEELRKLMGEPLQKPAGALLGPDIYHSDDDDDDDDGGNKNRNSSYIPEVSLYVGEGRIKKRILVLCTGGTLTMAPDPNQGGALAPVEGAISKYMSSMEELNSPDLPFEYQLHEYYPFRDSSDLGPADWATLAQDIKANYLHFDGFVVLTGTDTMAYVATALSFMLENLGKPVVFTGSQIPLCEPYNDARRNLIMAMIFASRDSINEVSIFFHDRLLRANRATKVNTHRLLAFDSPNLDPLATIGITIDENEHLILPPPKGALRVHTRMDTRLLTIRLVPGFDDGMIRQMIEANAEKQRLRALVLQLYGTGNIPSVKESFIQLLADAVDNDILVVASTQCFTGSVMMGHYATGRALEAAGVVSASDMTLEAIACKCAYLFGRLDLNTKEIGELMSVSLRGETTSPELLSPPPLSSAYQRAMKKKTKYF
ncbi:asparaginase-domain containing protein [Nitzschia inconspicua]|uniref:asparaginase n=1 Tax=Nitzschia inconspicua TaxID=303405 RepID=A0A9K3Q0A2_9STRA|nr:asparaginase-domain containing protein [Nitzschia inconspicua]